MSLSFSFIQFVLEYSASPKFVRFAHSPDQVVMDFTKQMIERSCFRNRSEGNQEVYEVIIRKCIKLSYCGSGLRHTYGFGAILCLALRLAAFQHSEYEQPDLSIR